MFSFHSSTAVKAISVLSILLQCLHYFNNILNKLMNTFNIFKQSSSEYGKPFNSIPGPVSFPLLGVIPHFFPFIGTFSYRMCAMDFSEKLMNKYGDIVRFASILGKKPTVFILTPELAAEVYQQQMTRRDLLESMVYFRREMRSDEFRGHFGVLASDGAEFRSIRRSTDALMLAERTISSHREQVHAVTDDAINIIETAWKTKNAAEFSESLDRIVRNWAFEALTTVTYGRRFGALDEGTPQQAGCEDFLACLNNMLGSIFRLEFGLAFWKFFSTPAFKRAIEDYDKHLQFVKGFAKDSTNCNENQDGGCLLHRIRRAAPDAALGVTSDIMLAGIDTVAHTTISILYVLACHPEQQETLRRRLRSADRTYLRACVREALRVLPTTGGNYRTTSRDITVGGYHVPKDVDVVLCHQYMSAQDEQFPEARQFAPARWLEPSTAPAPHPTAFLPFGTGARSCPGRTLANLEMECFLQQFVCRFRVAWNAPPPRFANPTINFLLPPYGFVLERVQD